MAYICHKDFDCEHCDSWRYDEDRMENACLQKLMKRKLIMKKIIRR